MIGKILSGILSFIISLVNIVLTPLDLLITHNLPSLNASLTAINALIDYIINIIGYVVNASCLSDVAIAMIVAYYTFSITATFSASVVKLALKWYNAIKPT